MKQFVLTKMVLFLFEYVYASTECEEEVIGDDTIFAKEQIKGETTSGRYSDWNGMETLIVF